MRRVRKKSGRWGFSIYAGVPVVFLDEIRLCNPSPGQRGGIFGDLVCSRSCSLQYYIKLMLAVNGVDFYPH